MGVGVGLCNEMVIDMARTSAYVGLVSTMHQVASKPFAMCVRWYVVVQKQALKFLVSCPLGRRDFSVS